MTTAPSVPPAPEVISFFDLPADQKAQWLVNHFMLTPADVRIDDNSVLAAACRNGHLSVVRWLVAHFELTPDDARANDNAVFITICKNGHLMLAQWFTAYFHFTP